MIGLKKNTGFIIDIEHIDGLSTIIRKKDIIVHYRNINKGKINDLKRTISTLRNSNNLNSGKIKFIVVKLTEWTFLNAILGEKKEIFKEFFRLISHYPHAVYIFDRILKKDFSVVTILKELDKPSKIHILDWLVNFKFYYRSKYNQVIRKKGHEATKEQNINNIDVLMDYYDIEEKFDDNSEDNIYHIKDKWGQTKEYNLNFLEIDDYYESVKAYENSEYLKAKFTPEDYLNVEEINTKLCEIVDFICGLKLDICPYSNRDDISLNIVDFISNILENTLFELYVSNEGYFSKEIDKFIDLFQFYLTKIRKVNFDVSKDINTSSIRYKFKSKELKSNDFAREFDEFKNFIELAELTPNEISKLLPSTVTDNTYIVSYFIKEWQRLKIDIQIFTDRRKIDFKEYVLNKILNEESYNQNHRLLPHNNSLITNNPFEQISQIININANNFNLYQNSDIQEFNEVQKVITGKNIQYSETDLELIKYFNEFADISLANQLSKYLEELKDNNTPIERKGVLKTKLTSFLWKYAEKIGENGFDKLLLYIGKLATTLI